MEWQYLMYDVMCLLLEQLQKERKKESLETHEILHRD